MKRALAVHGPSERPIVGRGEQDAVFDRNGGGNDGREVGCVADHASTGLPLCLARRPLRARLAAGRPAVRRTRRAVWRRPATLNPRSSARATSLVHFWVLGILQLIGRSGQVPAVGNRAARRGRRAASGFRSTWIPSRGSARRSLGTGGIDRARGRGRLDPRLPHPFLAQTVAKDVEIEGAQRDQQHGDEIEREDAMRERPSPRPFQPEVGVLIVRRIGIRRHRGSRLS